jgi:hypothetical protein
MPKAKAKSKSQVNRQEFLLEAPEIAVFMACCVIVNELRGLERSFRVGDLAQSVFAEKFDTLIGKLRKSAAVAERFDLVMPVVGEGEFATLFWRWFNWWDDYFRELTPTDICEIERLGREQRVELNSFRPKNHWIEYRQTPAIPSVAG